MSRVLRGTAKGLVLAGITLSFGVGILWRVSGARAPETVRVSIPRASQSGPIDIEWIEEPSRLTAEQRKELLANRLSAVDFCKSYLTGCRSFIDQFTELVTERSPLGPALLACRMAYETSESQAFCDAGRRMIVRRLGEAEGKVVYVGFEPGQSKEAECVRLQQCLRDAYAGATIHWPEGYGEEYLAYGQAPWVPGGYHPDAEPMPLRERYVAILAQVQESIDFTADLTRGVDIDALPPEEQFVIEYRTITDHARQEDARAMLRLASAGAESW